MIRWESKFESWGEKAIKNGTGIAEVRKLLTEATSITHRWLTGKDKAEAIAVRNKARKQLEKMAGEKC